MGKTKTSIEDSRGYSNLNFGYLTLIIFPMGTLSYPSYLHPVHYTLKRFKEHTWRSKEIFKKL